MADTFYGLNLGDPDGDFAKVQVGSSTNATSIEIRVNHLAGMNRVEAYKLIELLADYIIAPANANYPDA